MGKKILLIDHPRWAERLSKEWNYEKNEALGLDPRELTSGSSKKPWFRCSDCGHEWQTPLHGRTGQNANCPSCARRRTRKSIPLTEHPRWSEVLSQEWDYEKNNAEGVKPEDLTSGSGREVWWHCVVCGHSWKTRVNTRTGKQSGCPDCQGPGSHSHVLSDDPAWAAGLCREWDYERNDANGIYPDKVTVHSHQRTYWRCSKCGQEWDTRLYQRTRSTGDGSYKSTGCPACAGRVLRPGHNDLASRFPDVARDWHPTKNGNLRPCDITAQTPRRAWFLCSECGYEWESAISNRTTCGNGCPKCSTLRPSRGEKLVRRALEALRLNYRVEQRFASCRNAKPLPFDFAIIIPSTNEIFMLVEYQGQQHYHSVPLWGGDKGYAYRLRNDQIKRNWCQEHGIPLLEIPYTVDNFMDVARLICMAV